MPGHGTTLDPHYYRFAELVTTSGNMLYRLKQIDLDGTIHYTEPIQITLVTSVSHSTPLTYSLSQNYPNPFNPETEIKFSVDATAQVTLELYNTLGQKVATLFNDVAEAGRYYNIRVNATSLASGIYFYKLQSGGRSELRKMVVLR
ncbi:MAG: T9SS type A sorting domain-containing protein [Bacteroidota bacterium]